MKYGKDNVMSEKNPIPNTSASGKIRPISAGISNSDAPNLSNTRAMPLILFCLKDLR
jgi:hypothetical protein